jgi:hypothetical protein
VTGIANNQTISSFNFDNAAPIAFGGRPALSSTVVNEFQGIINRVWITTDSSIVATISVSNFNNF